MNATDECFVSTEKVWYLPYDDIPKVATVVWRQYLQIVLDTGTNLTTIHKDDVYESEEKALLSVVEKTYNRLDAAMKKSMEAKKVYDDYKKKGKKS